MHVEIAFDLSPRSFYPAAEGELKRRPAGSARGAGGARRAILPTFWKVVRGAFAYRRKTLVNSLALALDADRGKIERALLLQQPLSGASR